MVDSIANETPVRRMVTGLAAYAGRKDVAVVAVALGGLPLAAAVAQDLRVPLISLPVQAIRAAGNPAPIIGAVAAGGTACLDGPLIRALGLPEPVVHALVLEARWELTRPDGQVDAAPPPRLAPGATFIVVDEGGVTGERLRAVLMALGPLRPGRVVVAAPAPASQEAPAAPAEVPPAIAALVSLLIGDRNVVLS